MSRRFCIFVLVLIFFTLFSASAFAKSSYILPYPGAMPGSTLYKPRVFLEKLSGYWHFGNFGQFTYNLKQSDKYLVQAKILFEYGQYLLAYNALKKSDGYFIKTFPNLEKAKTQGKDIRQNRDLLSSAAKTHTEILAEIKKIVPDKFNWQPEKGTSTLLNLQSAIDLSISMRKKHQ